MLKNIPLYIKTSGAFLLAGLLLYADIKYFLSTEQRNLLASVSLQNHLLSILLVIPTYLLGGIELRLLYSRISKIKLSVYDTITLPFVINLWGFIIPQGSFFYTITYIFSKYKKSVSESIKVYLISFSISMSITGLTGILYCMFSGHDVAVLFIAVCSLLLLNPVLLALLTKLAETYKAKSSKWLKLILEKVSQILHGKIDKQLIICLVLLKMANVILTGLWCYWITFVLKIPLTFIQLILIALLMNLTALIKITPGNLGLSQFASGGIVLLVGGSVNDGFLLSSFQYLTIIILAIILGGFFSFLNRGFFSWRELKSIVVKKKNIVN